MKTLAFASDHAGYNLKSSLINYINTNYSHQFNILDCGTFSNESVDYPDYAHKLANSIADKNSDLGIAICGSGNGIAITLNRHKNIYAAICWEPQLATLARQHNNANVLVLPARFISETLAIETIEAFLNTNFEGGRHATRLEKINKC